MGDHHRNGISRAKAAGQQIINVADLGDGYALAGCKLECAFSPDGKDVCVLLVLAAGRNSQLVGLQAVPTVLAELGRIPIADLKAGIETALNPPRETPPEEVA